MKTRQYYLRECARRSVEVVAGVRIVKCHASIDVVIDVRIVKCHAIIIVGISTSCSSSQLVVMLQQFIITFPCSHFVHTFCTAKTCQASHFICQTHSRPLNGCGRFDWIGKLLWHGNIVLRHKQITPLRIQLRFSFDELRRLFKLSRRKKAENFLLVVQQVAPLFRTQTTTDRQTSLLVESDGHVIGELHAANSRVRCHRTRRPREILAWRTAGRSGTLCRTRRKSPWSRRCWAHNL